MQNAVALAYQGGESAPKVVAKGRGLIAEEIIARAKEHGIFVHESKEFETFIKYFHFSSYSFFKKLYNIVSYVFSSQVGTELVVL